MLSNLIFHFHLGYFKSLTVGHFLNLGDPNGDNLLWIFKWVIANLLSLDFYFDLERDLENSSIIILLFFYYYFDLIVFSANGYPNFDTTSQYFYFILLLLLLIFKFLFLLDIGVIDPPSLLYIVGFLLFCWVNLSKILSFYLLVKLWLLSLILYEGVGMSNLLKSFH